MTAKSKTTTPQPEEFDCGSPYAAMSNAMRYKYAARQRFIDSEVARVQAEEEAKAKALEPEEAAVEEVQDKTKPTSKRAPRAKKA